MKVPYGIHDYKTIKCDDYLYIDKTHFIKKLENIGDYLVFLRPRRFGKSLFTSMLYYYYDKKNTEDFSELFKETYIGTNKTLAANSYYVLKFDFSGINSEKDIIEKSFYGCVSNYLQRFINYYKFNIILDDTVGNTSNLLRNFFMQFETITKNQIYLIIDEYDHFANNVLTSDVSLFNSITGKDGFVRSFYEVLKTYAGTAIGRMFITGVTPITLDSLTSGFNMAINVSQNEIYLKTPNYIIKNVYFEYYYHYLNDELNTNIDVRFIKDSIRELSQNNNIKPFVEMIENFLKEISNRNFIKFDEKYVKLLMITYLRLTDLYLVKTEYEVNGRYIDIALLPNNIFELNNYFIIEVKYISSDNYNDKRLNEEKNNAVNQINDYADCDEMRRINNLKKYVLVFVYDKCKVVQEV